ncbi:MAG TPA: Ig-like domain-containing protein, partial [Methanofastidiosum sp.]|nr:Ig-like domain-containing protein [Methanofastidiosum sp.]HRS25698.1 Ig-like domain-containing protein [Methanofastidiosum sp.]
MKNKIISIGLVLVLLLTFFSSFVFADFASSSLNVSQVGNTVTIAMTVKNGSPKLFNVNATLGVTGDTSAISYSSGPSPASVDIPANNTQIFTWIYTANHDGIVNFSGTATGKRNNGVVHNTTATLNNVSITYVAANTAPVAQDGTLTVQKGASSSGTLVATDADNDTLTYSIVAGPSNGSVNITNTTTGAYTYTHNGTATSSDSFTFKANDGTSDSNIATITVTVNNTAPVAQDGTLTVQKGAS